MCRQMRHSFVRWVDSDEESVGYVECVTRFQWQLAVEFRADHAEVVWTWEMSRLSSLAIGQTFIDDGELFSAQ